MIMVEPFFLHPDPENDLIYGGFDPEKSEDRMLIEEIQEMGLLQPLLVRRHPVLPDEYIIVSGHRRYFAARAAGIARVEVLVMNTNTPEEIALAKLAISVSNHTRARNNPSLLAREIAHAEKALKELRKINPEKYRGKRTREVIAEELGISVKTVARTQKIAKQADKQTKQDFNAGKITQIEALRRVNTAGTPPLIEPLPGKLTITQKEPEKQDTPATKPSALPSSSGVKTINRLVRITERLEMYPALAADRDIKQLVSSLEKAVASAEKACEKSKDTH